VKHTQLPLQCNVKVKFPNRVEHVICSGAGCLRLLTYLQAQNLIIDVDDMEKSRPKFDARPYALANPQFKNYPLFGEFRGYDNPELIMALNPAPQVIFKTFSTMGHDPEKLREKTSIPVVVLEYGDLASQRGYLYQALRIMGKVVDREKRAEELVYVMEMKAGVIHEDDAMLRLGKAFSGTEAFT